jgi:hypothetical protein
VKWEECGRKRSLHILTYCLRKPIGVEERQKLRKALILIADFRNKNQQLGLRI